MDNLAETPFHYPLTFILRHRKENLKKCSLEGMKPSKEIEFFTYPQDNLPFIPNTIILKCEAPILTEADQGSPLLILDGTWKYAAQMEKYVWSLGSYKARSLPPLYETAYPRKQTDCPAPLRGLASIEALYIAYRLLGREKKGLLDHYFWKEEFLKKNATLFC
mgnify:CR=1 FL=1|tara:strand:- start:909 stop:1397 length:489 start_codon:yes stop_codon:yes gene_type:complete